MRSLKDLDFLTLQESNHILLYFIYSFFILFHIYNFLQKYCSPIIRENFLQIVINDVYFVSQLDHLAVSILGIMDMISNNSSVAMVVALQHMDLNTCMWCLIGNHCLTSSSITHFIFI